MISIKSLFNELEKIALSMPKLGPKTELAGLGLLGVPVASKLMDSKASKKEKALSGVEGAGLGALAAHTISHMK